MPTRTRRVDDDDRRLREIAKLLKAIHDDVHGLHPKLDAQEPAQTAILNRLSLLKAQGESIMSAISDFAAKQDAHHARQDTAVAGLQADVQALKDEIARLQTTPGTITPEDQALLDAIEARAAGISDKLEALDSLTPPATPPG